MKKKLNSEEGLNMSTCYSISLRELYPNCNPIFCEPSDRSQLKSKFWYLVKEFRKNATMDKFLERNIEKNKNIRSGKPVIKGTRITVEEIVSMVFSGMREADIIEQFNRRITKQNITAAMVYDFKTRGKYQIFFFLYFGMKL